MVPKFVSNPDIQTAYGYQEAHKLYDDMRQFFAQKASSTHQSEVVVIKVTMMAMKPAYKNPQIVSVRNYKDPNFIAFNRTSSQNISETISNIPLYIGVRDLKIIAYFTLLPLFLKWSKDQPLSIDNLQLRFKDWVELIPLGSGEEDVNAISSKFFVPKGKSKVLQFQRNKVLDLYLEMTYEMYSQFSDHLAELQNAEVRLLFTNRLIPLLTYPAQFVVHDQPRKTTQSYITKAGESLFDSEVISTHIETKMDMDASPRKRKHMVRQPSRNKWSD